MKKNPIFVILFLILALFILIPDLGLSQEKRDFFKVGVVTSLSGELAFGGTVTKRGYDLWAETVNSKGGSNYPSCRTECLSIA